MKNKKDKKKLYLSIKKERNIKYDNNIDNENKTIVFNKKTDLEGYCNGKCVPKKSHDRPFCYCNTFDNFYCDYCYHFNDCYCNDFCLRKIKDLIKLVNEERVYLKEYINERIIIYEEGDEIIDYDIKYILIKSFKTYKEFLKIPKNYVVKFYPSMNWKINILIIICIIFKNKLNMNYSSYHTDLILDFVFDKNYKSLKLEFI